MKLLIQRVLEGSVSVNDQVVSKIGRGLVVLLGIHLNDDQTIAKKLAHKLPKIRLWPGKTINVQQMEQKTEEEEEEKNQEIKPWNSSAQDNNYEILVVSQFTLYNTMKGNKPDFHLAKNSKEARELYEYFMEELRKAYQPEKIQGGKFQEMMLVQLVNDGPVTIEVEELKK